MQDRPRIGITTDVAPAATGAPRTQCALFYTDAIIAAGGLPILLAPDPGLAPDYLRLCDGFLFTGGDDPRTEPFGEPTHPAAELIDPRRQDFETALLTLLVDQPERSARPVLGICLGMQLMALLAGGRLHQHLPDISTSAARHKHERAADGLRASHTITIDRPAARAAGLDWFAELPAGTVDSHHHQAIADPGSMQTIARSDDGLIEAIAAPGPQLYLGIQWHAERTADPHLGAGLFQHLVHAAAELQMRRKAQ